MADVNRSRAQLLLVGALSLATIFLLLSVLLNSVIYTENLATRQTNVDADSAVTYRLDAQRGVGDAVEYVNRNGDRNYTDRYAEYERLLDAWRGLRTNYSVTDGRYTNVTPESGYEGTRVVDDNASTTMTPRNGNATWTVAPDVKSRNLVFDVNVSAGLPSESASDIENILQSNSTGSFESSSTTAAPPPSPSTTTPRRATPNCSSTSTRPGSTAPATSRTGGSTCFGNARTGGTAGR
ncbi:hypothetical protein ACFQJD_05050 [Haloplanus sp. GCM10025708]|uniref:hypothetical protein n=1 Tax=Haloplanus sp. GCM10025708 TaxID=3252679 RepID=UPI003612B60F